MAFRTFFVGDGGFAAPLILSVSQSKVIGDRRCTPHTPHCTLFGRGEFLSPLPNSVQCGVCGVQRLFPCVPIRFGSIEIYLPAAAARPLT
jgi:hypothetical protein